MAPTHTKKTEIGQSAVRSMRLRRSPQPLSLQIYSPGRHKRRGGGVVIPLKGGGAAAPPLNPPLRGGHTLVGGGHTLVGGGAQ